MSMLPYRSSGNLVVESLRGLDFKIFTIHSFSPLAPDSRSNVSSVQELFKNLRWLGSRDIGVCSKSSQKKTLENGALMEFYGGFMGIYGIYRKGTNDSSIYFQIFPTFFPMWMVFGVAILGRHTATRIPPIWETHLDAFVLDLFPSVLGKATTESALGTGW